MFQERFKPQISFRSNNTQYSQYFHKQDDRKQTNLSAAEAAAFQSKYNTLGKAERRPYNDTGVDINGLINDICYPPLDQQTGKGWAKETWLREKYPGIFGRDCQIRPTSTIYRILPDDLGVPDWIMQTYYREVVKDGIEHWEDPTNYGPNGTPRERAAPELGHPHNAASWRFSAKKKYAGALAASYVEGLKPDENYISLRAARVLKDPNSFTAADLGMERMSTKMRGELQVASILAKANATLATEKERMRAAAPAHTRGLKAESRLATKLWRIYSNGEYDCRVS
jgi:hypothetical protein